MFVEHDVTNSTSLTFKVLAPTEPDHAFLEQGCGIHDQETQDWEKPQNVHVLPVGLHCYRNFLNP